MCSYPSFVTWCPLPQNFLWGNYHLNDGQMSPIFSCTWTLSFMQLLVLVHFWASLVVVFWFFDGIKLPYLCMGNLSFQQFLRYILQHISQWILVRRDFCLWDVSSLCFLGSKTPRWFKEHNDIARNYMFSISISRCWIICSFCSVLFIINSFQTDGRGSTWSCSLLYLQEIHK